MILAKKRRLSQTDTGKSRKPMTQTGVVMTTPAMGSVDSRQDVVVNGDGAHTPMDVTNEDLSQTRDDAFSTGPPSVNTNDEVTSPQESQQPVASCSGTINIVVIKIRGGGG